MIPVAIPHSSRQLYSKPSRPLQRIFMSTSSRSRKSFLELAQGIDSFPYQLHDPDAYESFTRPYYRFKIQSFDSIFGLIPEKVVQNFEWPKCWTVDDGKRSLMLCQGKNSNERSALLSNTLNLMYGSEYVSIDRPKGELLPTFNSNGEHILNMDRAGCTVFGTVTYGIQLIGYSGTESGMRYWIPRRSQTKRNYPGMLDNCVGGALNTGETPLTSLMREASEEASLPGEYVRENAKPFGVVSYHMTTDGNGEEGHQPQVMYVYHMELTEDVFPKPLDGEVEQFEQMSLEEVKDALANSEFKDNCAATWIAYLISIGVINAENEKRLHKIMCHLHRRLDFPTK